MPNTLEFPVDSLSPILRDVAKDIHSVVKAPLALCCNSILAAATLTAQSFVDVEVDGRVYPVSNYFVTIADSGERKSTVDKISLTPINKWIEEQDKIEEQTQSIATGNKGAQPQQKSSFLVPLRIVSRLTFEGLRNLLAEQSPSVGIYSSEGGGVLGGYSMRKENVDSFSSGLSNLWDGGVWNVVQAGTGAMFLYDKRVSMHLMIQKHLREDILGSKRLWDQGLLSRILFVEPVSTIGSRWYESRNVYHEPGYKAYAKRVEKIFASGIAVDKELRGAIKTRQLSLSGAAKEVWVDFHDTVEQELGPNGKFHVIINFANKLAEISLRIAGVFELFENVDAVEVSKDSMVRGRDVAIFYMNHLLRLLNQVAFDLDQVQRNKLSRWLLGRRDKNGDFTNITVREIYKNSQLRTAKIAREVADQLADEGKLIKNGTDQYKIRWDLL